MVSAFACLGSSGRTRPCACLAMRASTVHGASCRHRWRARRGVAARRPISSPYRVRLTTTELSAFALPDTGAGRTGARSRCRVAMVDSVQRGPASPFHARRERSAIGTHRSRCHAMSVSRALRWSASRFRATLAIFARGTSQRRRSCVRSGSRALCSRAPRPCVRLARCVRMGRATLWRALAAGSVLIQRETRSCVTPDSCVRQDQTGRRRVRQARSACAGRRRRRRAL